MVQSISPVSRGKGRLSSSASLRLCPRAEASRMRLASKILASVLVLALSACDMKLTRTKTPSPPQPTEAKAEPPPSDQAANEPLSIPQTQVRLPRPQPIDPEALAMPPVSAPSEASAPRQSHRAKKGPAPSPPATVPAKPEQPAVETAEAPPPATEPARPRIEPVLPAEQRRQLTEDIASRLHEVDQILSRVSARKLTDGQKDSIDRIRNFENLSHQALDRGDTQQASALADRALLLARELVRAP